MFISFERPNNFDISSLSARLRSSLVVVSLSSVVSDVGFTTFLLAIQASFIEPTTPLNNGLSFVSI